MIKGSIQEEDVTNLSIYTHSIGAPQYIRQMLTSIKGEINSNTIIVGDFNTPLTPMDRSSRQKINKETQALNDTIGLPWWRSGWESACQCRGHGFVPQSGRIPHATERLGP